MKIAQFVMAYGVEQDRLRAILPEGFSSLRPVLRINGEIRDGETGCLELNTAVEAEGFRGWLNIGHWEGVPFTQEGPTVRFETELLEISFTAAGVRGGCPAEGDNGGCWFLGEERRLRPPEVIDVPKEFCHCAFAWRVPGGARGVSEGRTLPAVPTPPRVAYPREAFTAEVAARIPCRQVLGTYRVDFTRGSRPGEI